jgi:Na+/proline symporter
LYWKGTTKAGVIAGILSGAAIVIVWNRVTVLKEMMYELVPAFIIAFLVTLLVSKITQKPDDTENIFKQITDK